MKHSRPEVAGYGLRRRVAVGLAAGVLALAIIGTGAVVVRQQWAINHPIAPSASAPFRLPTFIGEMPDSAHPEIGGAPKTTQMDCATRIELARRQHEYAMGLEAVNELLEQPNVAPERRAYLAKLHESLVVLTELRTSVTAEATRHVGVAKVQHPPDGEVTVVGTTPEGFSLRNASGKVSDLNWRDMSAREVMLFAMALLPRDQVERARDEYDRLYRFNMSTDRHAPPDSSESVSFNTRH